jgi:hypothetical protein
MRLFAIAALVAGCAGRTSPPPANRTDPPARAVELVVSLHELFARDGLDVDQLAAAVGPIVERGDSGVTLHPTRPELADVTVVLLPSKALYLLELRLAAPVSILELRRVFGPGRRAYGFHGERDLMFSPPVPRGAWSVAVFASMSRCHDPHSDAESPGPCLPITDDSQVESVMFRRDSPLR